ncbi:MAG: VWA domain-containing protein, partial [Chthoniobacteraceae bacterium]|nr:VWA domain-containing protein [Chthoniobacteraceae bacterium]
MKDWISHLLSAADPSFTGREEWSFGCEGLSSGWAFFLFLLLIAAVVWAYGKYAPLAPRWRRAVMAALRGAMIAVFLVLLTRPVLNITTNESVRQNLLVLIDSSQSMTLPDHRDRPDDLKRAALAAGKLDPHQGLKQEIPPAAASEVQNLTRWNLVGKMTANGKLNLWPRLYKKTDVTFYQFGRGLQPVGQLQPSNPAALKTSDAVSLLRGIHPSEPATAIGDSLRQVVKGAGGQPISGIFLITDGGNNSGLPPLEAAQIARERNIPLFIYGVGVTSVPDLILRELT